MTLTKGHPGTRPLNYLMFESSISSELVCSGLRTFVQLGGGSSGRRADFRVPGPLEYLRRVLRPPRGERSLWGYRRALSAPGYGRARAFALYAHSRDFAQVVALDGPRPALSIGPKERENRLKLLGHRLGLFPVLAPSFALLAARRGARRESRLDRVLPELARLTGEPCPAVEHLVATRGNTAVVHTAVPGADPDEPAGRWTLHVPWSPQQEDQARQHLERTRDIRRRFPALPVPEPLHAGRVDGLYLTCERRLGGLTAPQLAGDHGRMARTYADVARALAGLVVERAAVDETTFAELVGAKVALVARYAAEPRTVRALERLRDEARERLLGRPLPRVLYHADLRSKHVQVTPEGRLLGLLDWGSSEDSDLPYFDLLHLVVHERKQEAGLSAEEAWKLVRGRTGLRPSERAALDDYASRIELDPEVCRVLESIYPVLVGAMAEKNWDYSRPRWVARNFGL